MWFINRFKEPSSWAGFAMIAGAFFHVPANTAQLVVQAASAVCAAIAVIVPEKKA